MKSLLKKFFITPTNHWMIQLFRYTFVGGLAFIVDFGTLFILKETFHIYYLIAAGIAFALGWLINYAISVVWVFPQKKFQNKTVEFLLFGAIGLVGLGLNEIFMFLLTDKVALHYLVSKIIATGGIYFWNFFARKFLLFNSNKEEVNK